MIRLVRMASRRRKETAGSSSPPGTATVTSRTLHRSIGTALGTEVIAVDRLEKT